MAKQRDINVALIGQGFMGRTHSNGWGQVRKFFQPPLKPVMHTVFGQETENPQAFAENWDWQNASTNWEELVKSPEIGLVDVVTPNFMHAPVARAAIAAGKPWPIGWSKTERSAISATSAPLTFKTGPMSRFLCCGASKRNGPAREPTAI